MCERLCRKSRAIADTASSARVPSLVASFLANPIDHSPTLASGQLREARASASVRWCCSRYRPFTTTTGAGDDGDGDDMPPSNRFSACRQPKRPGRSALDTHCLGPATTDEDCRVVVAAFS